MIAVAEQLRHQVRVADIALVELVARVVVVGLHDLAVLRVVVDADHLVATAEQILDDITTDETGRTTD
jgi:hypothetical protein